MNILDENILAGQRQLLESWRVHVRQIGFNLARSGMQDAEIIAFLLEGGRPTFFSRDAGFYDRRLCHSRYCLIYVDADKQEVAAFVRRLLRHPLCDTQAKRAGLWMWRLRATKELM